MPAKMVYHLVRVLVRTELLFLRLLDKIKEVINAYIITIVGLKTMVYVLIIDVR